MATDPGPGPKMPDYSETAAAMAFAGGVITFELIQALERKGMLTRDETRKVLENCLNILVPFLGTPSGPRAMRTVSSMIETLFPKAS